MEDGDEEEVVPAVPRAPNAADTAYLDAVEAVRPRAERFLPAALRDPPSGIDALPPVDVPLLALPPLPDPPTCLIPRPTTPPRGRRGRPSPPPPAQPTDDLAWSVMASAARRERARLIANGVAEEGDLT
ncbi:hypothetical protein AMAG_05274 [Allomyces macrogynus ATCC 38327]|uniref:Uncharacterized protein n=1 Tax=Allomyces macrogynus (strain ATCC 38327) TaxID=578462 RepID=A0A0L0SBK2_ALLM3|nr:hypothetical protein AMAG_05274 [Allomyces macrogynus ATCC 38327]|eukprot:KNE59817.1 hypothetical protein AMAG_05274 [Allomyces macrogynus ATCC 38327]